MTSELAAEFRKYPAHRGTWWTAGPCFQWFV